MFLTPEKAANWQPSAKVPSIGDYFASTAYHVVTRWNSGTRTLQKAKDKQLGANAEQILIDQSLQILNEISVETDKVQADNAVKDLVSAFADVIVR